MTGRLCQAALGRLTAGALEGSARATPFEALVEHVKGARSADEVPAQAGPR